MTSSQVLIEHDPSPMKLEVLGVDDWLLEIDAVGEFRRVYSAAETNYILEGSGRIIDSDGKELLFNEGDLLTLMPDTECTWHITEAVQRHSHKG